MRVSVLLAVLPALALASPVSCSSATSDPQSLTKRQDCAASCGSLGCQDRYDCIWNSCDVSAWLRVYISTR